MRNWEEKTPLFSQKSLRETQIAKSDFFHRETGGGKLDKIASGQKKLDNIITWQITADRLSRVRSSIF